MQHGTCHPWSEIADYKVGMVICLEVKQAGMFSLLINLSHAFQYILREDNHGISLINKHLDSMDLTSLIFTTAPMARSWFTTWPRLVLQIYPIPGPRV